MLNWRLNYTISYVSYFYLYYIIYIFDIKDFALITAKKNKYFNWFNVVENKYARSEDGESNFSNF